MSKKPKTPPETDPKQSERFRNAVREIEADGGLSPTEGADRFDAILRKVAPEKGVSRKPVA